MDTFRYARNYCEENVWLLCQEPRFTDFVRKVVFISNNSRECPLWEQKAAAVGEVVLWDYHVILVCRDRGWWVWDQDTRLGMPVEFSAYIMRTFRLPPDVPVQFAPMFRVIDADEYLDDFSSDRSHMLDRDGRWLVKPPSWNPIIKEGGKSLAELIDMRNKSLGAVMGLSELVRYFKSH